MTERGRGQWGQTDGEMREEGKDWGLMMERLDGTYRQDE